jgi:hypothetical protein
MFRRVVGHVRRQPLALIALFFALSSSALGATKFLTASAAAGRPGWSIQRIPRPKSFAQLSGVSCTSARVCIAVGSRSSDPRSRPRRLVERWNGSRWSIQPTPNPRHTGSLSAVSCTSAAWCIAVGYKGQQSQDPLVERWAGGRWSIQPTSNVGGERGYGGAKRE